MQVPFRIGATSYVLEDGLAGNAAYLAGRVQDMQLVLFDLPGGPSNLPTFSDVVELAALSAVHGLSYTVHLILDLSAQTDDAAGKRALRKAHEVIAATRALQPWAYVLHLDAHALRAAGYPPAARTAWQAGMQRSLAQAAAWAGGAARLAVENLEGYPPELVTPVAEAAGTSRCVDVGHLWRDGVDPLPSLARARDRLAVVHLHGVDPTAQTAPDHRALSLAGPAALDAVVAYLLDTRFDGIVTLEVFGEADFAASYAALEESIRRYAQPAGQL